MNSVLAASSVNREVHRIGYKLVAESCGLSRFTAFLLPESTVATTMPHMRPLTWS